MSKPSTTIPQSAIRFSDDDGPKGMGIAYFDGKYGPKPIAEYVIGKRPGTAFMQRKAQNLYNRSLPTFEKRDAAWPR